MGIKRILGRRRTEDDIVHIEDETANEWWTERDQLARPIDRRWRRQVARYPFRRATDVSGPIDLDQGPPSPFFAPPEDASADLRLADPVAIPPVADLRFAPADPIRPLSPQPRTYRSPWDVLGLTSDAAWDTVVARHRELAKTHHPDRVGPDATSRAEAADTMADINAAFHDLGRIYKLTDER